eukprot:CAMPEP_0198515088 /NCGR_PEP_ID=MMETSP1462-20131121/17107_1 /TAXON_ID=1333877 /ORGANISM="Brandtodinium nutriculum, Strain RCC3387" /LENGTH=95 /DNA_ID=CAMNT_0044244581 /DNA_START=163 /DNA_END=447 /DNA_ORIENTATION=+
MVSTLRVVSSEQSVAPENQQAQATAIESAVATHGAVCVQDPGTPNYFIAKAQAKAGWSPGDECYAQSGGVTPFAGKPCIGGSDLQACLSAAQAAG